jgi:hypothetical protein
MGKRKRSPTRDEPSKKQDTGEANEAKTEETVKSD